MIPQDKIEEVRAASDIVDVVEDFGVRLKQSGSRYKGLCPFHEEKTPSFSVDPDEKLYYCFGCQRGGNLFTFVQELEGASFVEAVRLLADRVGITLPEQDGDREKQTEVDSIYNALRFAARFYYRRLTQSEDGEAALDYLRGRGFEPATIKHFGLGYAPDQWDALLEAAAEHHISAEVLEKAGLVKPRKKGDGHYDVFRGRVMFPILSHIGKVLGFGGRILDPDDDAPKYINSPDTQVYNKRRVLYGLHQAKQAVRKKEEVLLVEGYTDVVTLHQAGVEHVVASSGTALTKDQIKLLSRYAERILLLYDADTAGTSAALRGIDLVLEQGMAAYVVPLPGGEDPDTYVREQGGEAFQEFVEEQRQDFTAFKYAQAGRAGKLDTPEDQAHVMRSIVESVAKIPDPLMRETYLRRASDVTGMPDIRLHEVLESIQEEQDRRSRRQQRRREDDAPEAPQGKPPEEVGEPEDAYAPTVASENEAPDVLPQEKMLLRLMLDRGEPLIEFILGNMAMDEFSEGPARDMAMDLLEMYNEEAVDAQSFLGGARGQRLQRLASELMMDKYEPSNGWEERDIKVPAFNEDPYEAAVSSMTLLKLRRVEGAIEDQKQKLFSANGQSVDLQELQNELMDLIKLRKDIQEGTFLDQDPV